MAFNLREYCCPQAEAKRPSTFEQEQFAELLRNDLMLMGIEIRMMATHMEMLASLENLLQEDEEDGTMAETPLMQEDRKEIEEYAKRVGIPVALDEVEDECVKKSRALIKTAKKGCEFLQAYSASIERSIAEINEQAGSERAFLDEQEVMMLLCRYDEMNPDSSERRVPLVRLLYRREVLRSQHPQL
jgi:tRNA(Ile)-lysidine synthase TilS/MesJ